MFKLIATLKAGVLPTLGAALLFSATTAMASKSPDCSRSGKGNHHGLRIVALTGEGHLVCFNERAPWRLREIGYVSGLVAPDTALIGIDYRVQDSLLYGVGNGGGVYRIDSVTAAAVLVNTLTVALDGTSFGVDFNPAADRLRIVSNTGQNLRHNVNAGGVTLSDGALAYAPGSVALGVSGSAYTNNDLDVATATTLFDLDTNLDQIAIQAPPNNGSLGAVGKLGVDAAIMAGFDIYSRAGTGVTTSNVGYAVLNTASASGFYRINILTGKATLAGSVEQVLVDIGIPLNQ